MIDCLHCSGSSSSFQIELIRLWISELTILPTALINSGIWSVTGDLCLFSFSIVISSSVVVCAGTIGSAVCMLANVHLITERMIPPHSQHPVTVCNQITVLILYYISLRMLTLLKIIDAPIQNSDTLVLTVCFTFINFSFQVFLLYITKLSASFVSYISNIMYVSFIWIL